MMSTYRLQLLQSIDCTQSTMSCILFGDLAPIYQTYESERGGSNRQ
jgi:hypothetical protein